MSQPIERVNYFNGELLGAADFKIEQSYNTNKLAWLDCSMFTYGVAAGLEVCNLESQRLLAVSPGMAIDSKGREIILTTETTLTHNCTPGLYYLTITYEEQYADRTIETGVINFKRIREVPKIMLSEEAGEPGINILLALVTVTNNGALRSIEDNNGISMRRQCGVRVGAVNFQLDGVPEGPAITARQNAETKTWRLEVTGRSTQFSGPVSCKQTLLVGSGQSTGDSLTVRAQVLEGTSRIETENNIVTSLERPFTPMPTPGDTLIALDEVGQPGQRRTVTKVYDSNTLAVDLPYDPQLVKVPYQLELAGIASFRNSRDQAVLELDQAGNVGIGMAPRALPSQAWARRFVVTVQTEGKVGIGLATEPEETLQVGGNVKAKAYLGDGSRLSGLTGMWPSTPANPNDIYYKKGTVSIGTEQSSATLSVTGEGGIDGDGTITSTAAKITGEGTRFTEQLRAGDHIRVTEAGGSKSAKVVEVESENSATVEPAFEPALNEAAYTIERPIAAFYEANEPTPVLWVSPNRQVGINRALPQAALHVGGDLIVDGSISGEVNIDRLDLDQMNVKYELTVGNQAVVLNNSGNVTCSGNLNVRGEGNLASLSVAGELKSAGAIQGVRLAVDDEISGNTLAIKGIATVGTLTVKGKLTVAGSGELAVDGAITASGNLSATALRIGDPKDPTILSQNGTTAQLQAGGIIKLALTEGEQSSLSLHSSGDLVLSNPHRNATGRALVPAGIAGEKSLLVMNFGQDFTAGVQIQGPICLPNLQEPANKGSFVVVMDEAGNLHRGPKLKTASKRPVAGDKGTGKPANMGRQT